MSYAAGAMDSFLKMVAPAIAARRIESQLRIRKAEVAHKMIDELERQGFLRSGYQGASKERGYSKWSPGGGSPDEDLLEDLPEMRERSRDLLRNDPHARGLVRTWVSNVVGSGLRPQSRPDAESIGITESQSEQFQKAAQKAFRRWSRKMDTTGTQGFGAFTALLVRAIFECGDVFCLPRPLAPRKPYSLRLQAIEADRVSTPPNKAFDLSIREGVKIGPLGEREGYWVKRTHPGDSKLAQTYSPNDFDFIPAVDAGTGLANIWHLYQMDRPDQSRGVPFLHAALLIFKDLNQYFRAELMAAKIAACYSLFIVTPDPTGMAASQATKNAQGQQVETIESGLMRYLGPGQDIKESNPSRPTSAFSEFVERCLRAIGTSLAMPYEHVSQDFSKTTYTSGRMALNEVRSIYRQWQNWVAEVLCQPIWERVLEEAFLKGDLPAPRDFYEFQEYYCQARWVGPGWTWVDPAKEVTATVDALENNLTTLAEECAARGIDWEEVIQQRAREKKMMEELGVLPEKKPPAPASTAQGESDGQTDQANK